MSNLASGLGPVPDAVTRELGRDERLLWWESPRQGLALRRSDALMIPFTLLWGGFAIVWEIVVVSTPTTRLAMKLWGIPFALIGVYLIIGRFFADAYQRKHMLYALTSERALIVSSAFGYSVTSLDLKTLPEISYTDNASGAGSVKLGVDRGVGRSRVAAPQFEFIRSARAVFELIRATQREIGNA